MAHISRCKHGLGLAECDECFPKDRLLEGWKEGYARMNKPHKWAKEIKAWADGAEIEEKYTGGMCIKDWSKQNNPQWHTEIGYEYRIKPQPKDLKEKIERMAAKVLSEGFSTQPKEPQYLYVYQTKDGFPEFQILDFYIEHDLYRKYIGKIKLEKKE